MLHSSVVLSTITLQGYTRRWALVERSVLPGLRGLYYRHAVLYGAGLSDQQRIPGLGKALARTPSRPYRG